MIIMIISNWDEVAEYLPADDHPIPPVSWNDATAHAKWMGKRPSYRSGMGVCRPRRVEGQIVSLGDVGED